MVMIILFAFFGALALLGGLGEDGDPWQAIVGSVLLGTAVIRYGLERIVYRLDVLARLSPAWTAPAPGWLRSIWSWCRKPQTPDPANLQQKSSDPIRPLLGTTKCPTFSRRP